MSNNIGRQIDELMKDMLDRLDRIEQSLKEIGPCPDCKRAHRRGQTDCD